MSEVNFQQIMSFAAEQKVSDVHFQPGSAPMVRLKGELVAIKHPVLTEEDMVVLAGMLTRDPDEDRLKELKETDGTYALPDVGRFRYSLFRQKGRLAAVLRVVPLQVLDFETLGLPPALGRIAGLQRGLVLVTGATGNGKSTTLAAIVEHINQHRRAHVVTIEDPIEFLFDNHTSIISQREVGTDTASFKDAVRGALRQDPDVILVGELRDHETVDICLKAAETGHLVLSTIHTADATRTVGRVLGFYSVEEQVGIRQRLSENLMAIVSLRLLMDKSGEGQLPATEIMLVTRTIEDCITNPEKTRDIGEHIAKNRDLGMQTFNQSLAELVRAEKISLETARMASSHPEELERDLTVE